MSRLELAKIVSRVCHDHFVLLLDKEDFENPPSWLSENFNIIEGGTHTGGSSRNKLIIFKDGTYLELFTWISTPVEFMAWANKPTGLIDFAMTTIEDSAEDNVRKVNEGINSSGQAQELGVSFSSPSPGGRQRKDGVEVKWMTTKPVFSEYKNPPDEKYFPSGRLDVPFFCHDVTNRTVRVPFKDDKITTHPCGALGIHSVRLVVPQDHLDAYVALYRAVLGVQELWYMDECHLEYASFTVGVPNKELQNGRAYLDIYAPDGSTSYRYNDKGERILQEDQNEKRLTGKGIGIFSLVLRKAGDDRDGHNIDMLDDERTVLLQPWHLDG